MPSFKFNYKEVSSTRRKMAKQRVSEGGGSGPRLKSRKLNYFKQLSDMQTLIKQTLVELLVTRPGNNLYSPVQAVPVARHPSKFAFIYWAFTCGHSGRAGWPDKWASLQLKSKQNAAQNAKSIAEVAQRT